MEMFKSALSQACQSSRCGHRVTAIEAPGQELSGGRFRPGRALSTSVHGLPGPALPSVLRLCPMPARLVSSGHVLSGEVHTAGSKGPGEGQPSDRESGQLQPPSGRRQM